MWWLPIGKNQAIDVLEIPRDSPRPQRETKTSYPVSASHCAAVVREPRRAVQQRRRRAAECTIAARSVREETRVEPASVTAVQRLTPAFDGLLDDHGVGGGTYKISRTFVGLMEESKVLSKAPTSAQKPQVPALGTEPRPPEGLAVERAAVHPVHTAPHHG